MVAAFRVLMRARRMRPRRASDLVEWWKPRWMTARRSRSCGVSLTLTVWVATIDAMPGSIIMAYGIASGAGGDLTCFLE